MVEEKNENRFSTDDQDKVTNEETGETGEKAGQENTETVQSNQPEDTGQPAEETPDPENEEGDPVLTRLKEEKESLIQEKESYYRQLLRLQADFDNYRKRINREKEKIAFNTKVNMLDDLLPVIDNFERALGSFNADDDFLKGVEMIYRQLLKFLMNNGVEVIPAEGECFDHNIHEAVMQVEDPETESGVIIEELQKGYMLDDRVIRPAMVKVSS